MSDLSARAEAINERYRQHFAGQARRTRDLALLDQLIADLAAVQEQAQGELLATLARRREVYQSEREVIARLQAEGREGALADRLDSLTMLTRRIYGREFAGKRRATRDLGLLEAMRADQKRWLDRIEAMEHARDPRWRGAQRAQMAEYAELYRNECGEVATARAGGAALERASLLASLANQQFELYRIHFQGQQRQTRRPALLKRLVSSLSGIYSEMVGLKDRGLKSRENDANIDRVARTAAAWRRELGLIEQARAGVAPDQLAAALGREANDRFARYRDNYAGKARKGADTRPMLALVGELYQVALAMDELGQSHDIERNGSNLDVVLGNLRRYERELDAIAAANT